MKNRIFLICLIPLVLFSCKKDNSPTPIPDINLTPRQSQIVANCNRFGFDLFQKINHSDKNKNIFISPLSVSIALGMTLNGASGSTRAAMEQTLRMNGMTTQEINETYKNMIDYLRLVDPMVQFNIANSIWYRQDFTVLPDFLKVNQDFFYASVNPLDFNDPASVNTINTWVSDNTHEKITQIIDNIDPATVMFLINAIYFKGSWQYKFDIKNTTSKVFHPSNGFDFETPMMSQKGKFNYFANDLLQAIELPYNNGRYNMYVFLPATNKNVEDIIAQLNEANWENWLSAMAPLDDIQIQLPKFKFSYDKKLKEILTDMGMGIAFSDMANFTGINSSVGLSITEVKHKTFVEVNEEGTEAAAVTSVEIGVTSVPEITYFIADKPFIFAIVEKQTKSIVFIGKINEPVN